MINQVRSFFKFEIKFVVETLLSLIALLTVSEVLLGPLFTDQFYIINIVEALNTREGLIIMLISAGAYAWASEEEYANR